MEGKTTFVPFHPKLKQSTVKFSFLHFSLSLNEGMQRCKLSHVLEIQVLQIHFGIVLGMKTCCCRFASFDFPARVMI